MNCFGFLLGAMAHFVLLLTFRVEISTIVYHKEYMMVMMTDTRTNFSFKFADEAGRPMAADTKHIVI